MEQEHAFKAGKVYVGALEGAVLDDNFSTRVDNAYWLQPGEGTILSDQFFVEWLIYSEDDVECASPGRDFVPSRSIIFLPPGHDVRARWGRGRFRTISCCFRPEMLAATPELSAQLSSLQDDRRFNLDSAFLRAAMTRIGDECLSPGLDSQFTVRAILQSICGEVQRLVYRQPASPPPPAGTLSLGQLGQLRAVLHESPKLPGLEDLANSCGVSMRALSPLVKKATGVTLRHYVARERLNRAKALLDDRRLMVKQVAYSCGFASAAAFTAAFRKTTGMTPLDYRKRCWN